MGDRWYAVCEDYLTEVRRDKKVWTVSRDPLETGWETDGGCDGYGLTKADAEFLAAAANEKVECDG
jgi:hypothetical protein